MSKIECKYLESDKIREIPFIVNKRTKEIITRTNALLYHCFDCPLFIDKDNKPCKTTREFFNYIK